jgi:hypothetical protein
LQLLGNMGFAQIDSSDLVIYDPDFKFVDGIFISFDQVKKNNPVLKSRIVSNISFGDPDFFNSLLVNPELSYYDNFGVKQTVSVDKIWGYAKNGNLYIRLYENFNKITYVGSICHFVATITISYQPVYDPYSYNSNYYRTAINNTSSSKTEIQQYVFDFETGKIYEYEEKNLEIIFLRDPQLFDEFMALNKKHKKQMLFYYIRKFNERNQLKFPVVIE